MTAEVVTSSTLSTVLPGCRLLDLPPKHLSRIFTLAGTYDASSALTISHLNKTMRVVALSTPEMWSTFDSSFSLAGLNAFATRASNASATFDIRIAPSLGQRDTIATSLPAFLDAVRPFASRWRSITVDAPIADWMDGALAAFTSVDLVMVDTVILRVSSNGLQADYFIRGPEAGTTLPCIPFMPRTLVLDGVPAFQLQLFSYQLKELVVRNMQLPLPPPFRKHTRNATVMASSRALRGLLREAPRLKSLTLAASAPEPEETVDELLLHELISLAVCGASTVQFALDTLAAPGLASLDIEWAPSSSQIRRKVVTEQHAEFLGVIAARFPCLTRLRIATTAEIDEEAWSALFSSLHLLHHLTLEAIEGPPALAAVRAARPPLLSELVLRHVDDVHAREVAEVVASRLGVHGITPLRLLQLMWCEQLDADSARLLEEGVPYVVLRTVDEEEEHDLDFAMDEMELAGGSSEDDEDNEQDDEDMMDDSEDDLQSELAMLREDNRAHGDMVRH
ncbi:hypothetical protein BKA62DRAFT_662814 [Auriculariales sp. MPI-PUGE-AT-0066]|nr:hypothetical protein BKA62DRAFT_662814 [Auriculariales sp. MPI-PUGE-AT-0066]